MKGLRGFQRGLFLCSGSTGLPKKPLYSAPHLGVQNFSFQDDSHLDTKPQALSVRDTQVGFPPLPRREEVGVNRQLAGLSLTLPSWLPSDSTNTKIEISRRNPPCELSLAEGGNGFASVSTYNHIQKLWQNENSLSHSLTVFVLGPCGTTFYLGHYSFFP